MSFSIGDRVEVIGHETGLYNSLYAGKVVEIGPTTFKIEYEKLITKKTGLPLVEEVPISLI